MADLALLYAEDDRLRVAALARVFEQHGYKVWREHAIIPTKRPQVPTLPVDAARASCLIPVWTNHSQESPNYRMESQRDATRDQCCDGFTVFEPLDVEDIGAWIE